VRRDLITDVRVDLFDSIFNFLNKKLMLNKLANIEKKYLDLREQSMNPDIISDQQKSIQINREISSLQDLYDLIQEYKKYEEQVA